MIMWLPRKGLGVNNLGVFWPWRKPPYPCPHEQPGWLWKLQGKKLHTILVIIALTIQEVSTFVQIDLEIGTLDVELKVLLHWIYVVEDVINDPEEEIYQGLQTLLILRTWE